MGLALFFLLDFFCLFFLLGVAYFFSGVFAWFHNGYIGDDVGVGLKGRLKDYVTSNFGFLN